MILIKMDKLSESELRSIAEQESIDSWETLSRTELIDALTEKYEEEDDDFAAEDRGEGHNLRYLTGLTDYRELSDSVEGLPGVEDLPPSYPETSIHLLYKNTNWGYAFWSISNLDMEKLEQKNASLVLIVSIADKNGTRDQYDIPVTFEDREWNIGFSTQGGKCSIAIAAEYPNGERDILAASNRLQLTSSYWLNNKSEMRENDALYKVYMSLLSTKEGSIIENSIVREISSSFCKEDVNE